MGIPSQIVRKRTHVRIRTLGLAILLGAPAVIEAPARTAPTEEIKRQASNGSAKPAEPPAEKAWRILDEGLKDANSERRAKAVRALGLLTGSAGAEKAAVAGLKDEKVNVRLAAAAALGSMHAEQAAGNLEEALGDSEPSVVLAAANSLLLLHDDVGYDTYYEVLTGGKRANKGLIKEELDTLKDKKKMAQLGFEEGIGFIPFAGIGYEVFKTVTKDDSSPLRAAALEAVALRGDPSLLSKISAALDDDKDLVRFTAAACVVHLSGLPKKPGNSHALKP